MSDITNSILDTDLSTVDMSKPLVTTGLVELIVDSVKIEPTSTGGQRINTVLKLVNRQKGTKGEDINPGYPIFHGMSITPTEKYSIERIKQAIKELQLACGPDPVGAFGNGQQYVGQKVMAMLVIKEDAKGEYPAKNEVKRFVAR